jgi:hypothetical protein
VTRINRQLRVAFLCALPIALALTPLEHFSGGVTLCVYKLLFHVDCPGCGMTRACAAVMQMRFSDALAFNRGVIIVFPILAWTALKQLHADLRELFAA